LDAVDPGTRRQSRIGSLGQLLREPPGSNCSRAKPSFAHARVPMKHGRHTRVAPCRTPVFGCIEVPPSSSLLTAVFAPQLLLLTCRAISASPLPRGSRELAVRGSSELTASGRHLHTSSLCTSSSYMVILLPPVAGPALASALPRRRSLRDRPCQGTAMRDLVALRASRSRAATPHLHPRTPEPRASLARIALQLTRLNPPCAPLLVPGRSPPLGSCSCAHTPTPPASAPYLLQRLFLPSSRAHSAPVSAHACSRVARTHSEPQTHACSGPVLLLHLCAPRCAPPRRTNICLRVHPGAAARLRRGEPPLLAPPSAAPAPAARLHSPTLTRCAPALACSSPEPPPCARSRSPSHCRQPLEPARATQRLRSRGPLACRSGRGCLPQLRAAASARYGRPSRAHPPRSGTALPRARPRLSPRRPSQLRLLPQPGAVWRRERRPG
jgi:hypothetical protein